MTEKILVFNALSTYLLLPVLVMISIRDLCMCITKNRDGFLLCDQSKLPNQSIFLLFLFSQITSIMIIKYCTPVCIHCKNSLAEIFQENGDFCLDCWQELTYPKFQ
jgi:hypothetical protein